MTRERLLALPAVVLFAAGCSSAPAAGSAGAGGAGERKENVERDAGATAAGELLRGEILGVEEMTWADAEPLCPQAGEPPAPGASGRLLTIRAESGVRRVFSLPGRTVVCKDEAVSAPETGYLDPDLDAAVEVARRDLADRLEVAVEEITARAAEKVVWPDSSLGCPEPDRVYMQVLTPGARIRLETRGQIYAYHLAAGGEPRYCAAPSRTPPLPAVEYE